jgi:hypothetical protein
MPEFINIADAINTALRRGIVVGLDTGDGQLWYSPLDGWDGIISVSTDFSGGDSTALLTVELAAGGSATYEVPTDPFSGYFRVKGENEDGRVVQFVGTMADLQPWLVGTTAAAAVVPAGADGATDPAGTLAASLSEVSSTSLSGFLAPESPTSEPEIVGSLELQSETTDDFDVAASSADWGRFDSDAVDDVAVGLREAQVGQETELSGSLSGEELVDAVYSDWTEE